MIRLDQGNPFQTWRQAIDVRDSVDMENLFGSCGSNRLVQMKCHWMASLRSLKIDTLSSTISDVIHTRILAYVIPLFNLNIESIQ